MTFIKNKKMIISCIIILIVLIVLFSIFLHLPKKPKEIKTYGNIEIRQVELSFMADGIINNLYKEEGDSVQEGELIATINPKDYIASYKKAKYEKEVSIAKFKDSSVKYKMNLPLCKKQIVSQENCEELFYDKQKSKADVNLKKAQETYQKNQLSYTKMYAPQNGIITTRVQEKGAKISNGQIVYILSLNNPIWVRTYIKEQDLGNITYGQSAIITTDSIDVKTNEKKIYKGRIGYISPVAEFTPKTVQTEDLRVDLVYRIRVYIDKNDEFLRQGMPVSITIPIEKK